MKKYKVAVVGATGAVGREMLRCIFQFKFPFESIKLLASARSAGKVVEFEGHEFTVEELTENSFEGIDAALALVWQLVPSLLGVLFLILVLSAVFASRLSGRVVEPLNNLDLEHPEEINVYEEVEPLISKIYRQNRQIRLQLEAARRQQKEFSIITENMQEGLLVIDRYTMVLSVNSSVGKLLKVNEVRTPCKPSLSFLNILI